MNYFFIREFVAQILVNFGLNLHFGHYLTFKVRFRGLLYRSSNIDWVDIYLLRTFVLLIQCGALLHKILINSLK